MIQTYGENQKRLSQSILSEFYFLNFKNIMHTGSLHNLTGKGMCIPYSLG